MKLPKCSVERVMSTFQDLDVKDPRRKQRVLHTVSRLASAPRASFPEAMGSEADIEGAYRLMSSPHVTMDQLNEAHARVTGTRAREVGRVIAIHDTTQIECKHADPAEIGYLPKGVAGFLAHYTLIVERAESHRPLGVAHVEAVSRFKPPAKRSPRGYLTRTKRRSEVLHDPERESLKWLRGFTRASEVLKDVDVVHVADRESDSYEIFADALAANMKFVIRAARTQERRAVGIDDSEEKKLPTILEGARGLLTREVELAARKNESWRRSVHSERSARTATLTFAAARVTLPRPQSWPVRLPDSLELNVVRVFEANPPPNEDPIEWVLFTTEPIATAADVEQIVDIYRARWLIEECNKALKTGCRYEDRQFESRQALLTLFAMTLPIACELLWLRAVCRRNPKAPATHVLTPLQLQILAAMGSRALPPKPTAHDALWAVAALGGHLKSNGEPGWLILHRGMTKLLAYGEGWRAREALGLSISR